MSMIRKLVAVIAAFVLTSTSVFAEQWINISSWSYNEVSSFVSAGLLPESLEEIDDYRQFITRLQFCDLVESVIKKTKAFYDLDVISEVFCDTAPDSSASFLYSYGIVEGVSVEDEREKQLGHIYSLQNMKVNKYFEPDSNITREDAAVIIYRSGVKFGSDIWHSSELGGEYNDSGEISDYAVEAVGKLRSIGIVTDVDNNMFCPKSNITIEQAIVMVYRMYSSFSKIIVSDYEGIVFDGAEKEIKKFENGFSETYDGKMIRIKDNQNILLELEADVYSMINCAEYSGKRMAFAVNFNDKTDVYDIDTGSFMYEIPYIVIKIDEENGYVYTVSSRWYPVLYGLYSMDGYEIAEPCYSETELEEIKKNGFSMPQESYRMADGILYYSDKADGSSLYKVDTNGENRQKLSDVSSWDISYYDNRLFFRSFEDSALHIINTDGTDYKNISVPDKKLLLVPMSKWVVKAVGSGQQVYTVSEYSDSMRGRYAAEGYAYATDGFHSELYSINLNEIDAQIVKIDEGNIRDCLAGNGCIYYQRDLYSDLFMTDGVTMKQITDGYKIDFFGYAKTEEGYDESKILFTVLDDEDILYEYDIETGKIVELTGYDYIEPEEIDVYRQLSDDSYSFSEREDGSAGFSVWDGNGNKVTDILGMLHKRIGNKIIYVYIEKVKEGKNDRSLVSFDLDTGDKKVITDDIGIMVDVFEDSDNIMYIDTKGMVYIYNEEEGAKTVFPCRGIYKYGELLSIETLMPENAVYKLDVNGRFCRLTDDEVTDMLYVPNS